MGKRYTLQRLLEHAEHMEETLPSAPPARNQVNRVHQKRHHKPKIKLKPKPTLMTRGAIPANFLGLITKGPDHSAQRRFLLEEGSFRPIVQK